MESRKYKGFVLAKTKSREFNKIRWKTYNCYLIYFESKIVGKEYSLSDAKKEVDRLINFKEQSK